MIESILTAIGGTALLLTAVAWLTRSLIGQLLSKDLEKYKEELKGQTQIQIERYKNELQMQSTAQQIKFSRLHEKQAELVEELYFDVDRLDQLSKLLIGLFASSDSVQDKKNRAQQILEEYLEFNAKFHKNKLYFSEKLYSLLTSYRSTIFDPAMVLLEDITDSEKEKFMSEYVKSFSENRNQISALTSEIEKEFRNLLGVTEK